MSQIPAFSQAVERFRKFLASKGRPRELSWIFREDFYSLALDRYVVVEPRPEENQALAEAYYERAQGTGIVQLRGLFQVGEATAAAVWTPAEVSNQVKDWPPGLKLAVAEPFAVAKPVEAGLSWWLHRLTWAYRYNLKRGFDVPLRSRTSGGGR